MLRRSDFLRNLAWGSAGLLLPASLHAKEDAPSQALAGDSLPPQDAYEINAHFVRSAPGFGNRIALTYDDGPSPGVTDKVLAELEKRRLRATFFMIGNKVKAYPALAREVVAAGHEVANHTYTHPALSGLSDDRVREELRKCQDIIAETVGRTPVWFRPPYGAFHNPQGAIPRRMDLGVAYWSVDPRDWSQPGVSAIIDRVVKNAVPGSIILLHDLHRQTADATGSLLDRLGDNNYQFAQLSRILGFPYGPYV